MLIKRQLKTISGYASMACAIHCIFAPFIIMFSPFTVHIFENIVIEYTLLISSITFGIFIIYSGYCKHKKLHSIILFITGIILWSIHAFGDHHHDLHLNTLLVIIGSCFVLSSYYFNHKTLNCHSNHYCSNNRLHKEKN